MYTVKIASDANEQKNLKVFWGTPAKKFAVDRLKAVCTPTSIGLAN